MSGKCRRLEQKPSTITNLEAQSSSTACMCLSGRGSSGFRGGFGGVGAQDKTDVENMARIGAEVAREEKGEHVWLLHEYTGGTMREWKTRSDPEGGVGVG
eukprot:CAMPEP_0194478356 /NCGR_PEP_ID=MMETSP0253-20130528/1829_1 /TAXON_ID=2966 /ORGANISM="Noctiluca scintillans" /LENGTH=99 /DNA_ID=CAMNT_0039317437 /DNA_START=36 /DNA_END=331 /DNA_ORIENTATION=+